MEKLQIKSVQVKLSALKPDPLLTELGLDNDKNINDLFGSYTAQTKEIGYYERFLITADNTILTNLHSWSAMISNGVTQWWVDKIENSAAIDLIRVINSQSIFFKRSYLGRARLFKKWQEYLTQEGSGKNYGQNIPGDRTTEKISWLTGYSNSTVKMYLAILESDESLFQAIGEEENMQSLVETYNNVQSLKKDEKENGSEQQTNSNESTQQKAAAEKKQVKLGYNPSLVHFSFNAGIIKLSYDKGKELKLNKVSTKETKGAIITVFETEDKAASVEIKIKNPSHIKELS